MKEKDLWHGRFKKEISIKTLQYLNCLKDDIRLMEIDADVVKAHCQMLRKIGYLNKSELKKITTAIENFKKDVKSGRLNVWQFALKNNFTDIHPIIEKYIIDKCGIEIGGKTHLGKSRNDQIVTDMKIYLRNETKNIFFSLLKLIKTLIHTAQNNYKTLMPGYTHLQPAQTITFSHYLLSYIDIFMVSLDKLNEINRRINLSSLGACALAGTTIKIDRHYTAKLLGFDGNVENTIDAVSNRNFVLDIASELAIIMTTLSRMSEDLILWSTQEFNLVELSDEFCDTSTAMPQKKNPSTLELMRGKTATVIANLTELFIILKSLPTGYNQDLQQMKPCLWQIIDFTKTSIVLMSPIIETLRLNKDKMLESVIKGNTVAIDLAEKLTKKKLLDFRQSHFLVGAIIKELLSQGKEKGLSNTVPEIISDLIRDLSKKMFNKVVTVSTDELKKVLEPGQSILSKTILGGGPNPAYVKTALNKRLKYINKF